MARRLFALGTALAFVTSCGTSSSEPSGAAGASASTSGNATSFGGSGSGAGGNSGGAGVGNSAGAAGAPAGAGGSAGSHSSGAGSGGQAGSPPSCSPGYLLCEDFEAADAGSVPSGWTAHGMAAVAEDQAHGGKRSLKVSPQDNGERRIYHSASAIGAAHWGRVYYRVQLPIPDAFVHSTIVTFFGSGPGIGDAEFRVVDTVKDASMDGFAGGKHQFLYNVQPDGPEFGATSDYDYTFDGNWHCAEWHVDATTQKVEFYFDGVQVPLTPGDGYAGPKLPMAFSEVRVGWNNYQSAPPGFTAWIDDFAVAAERVGCLK